MIERAAQVIEAIELGRLSGELAGVASCEDRIHFGYQRRRIEVELNTAA